MYQTNNIRDIRLYCDNRLSLYHGYSDPIIIVCNKLYEILTQEQFNKKSILNIREYSYSIAKYNLPINLLYRELLGIFLSDPKYIIAKKNVLVKLFATSEHLNIQSYRLLIQIESLFIQIHYLLALRNDEVQGDEEEQVQVLGGAARPHENKEEECSHKNIGHNGVNWSEDGT